MWKRIGALLLPVLVVGVLGSCSLPGSSGSPMEGAGDDRYAGPTVVVENQHWSDVVVYTVRAGERRRLGMVTTAQTVTFRLRSDLYNRGLFRLRAEVIGTTRAVSTDRLDVGPGSVVLWTLMNQLNLSHYEIR